MKNYETKSLFVAWLYEILRDHLPAGTVYMTINNTKPAKSYTLSSGPIGEYADEMRKRLELPDGRFNLRDEVMKQAAWVMNVPLEQVTLECLQSNEQGYVYRLFGARDEQHDLVPCSSRHDTDEAAQLEALVLLTNYWGRARL